MKPINIVMLFIGGGIFATTLVWWVIPLTLITYVLLVLLATRDPLFQRNVLGKETVSSSVDDASGTSDLSPERRARWLPRGETRRTVEKALVAYRKLVTSIESSGEVARSVLDDAVPKLHTAAERLVQVAQEREQAAEAIQEMGTQKDDTVGAGRRTSLLRELEDKIKQADEEISGTYERLLTLRARMVGASLNSEIENRTAASELNRSLDELNFRLEALRETSTDDPHNDPREDGRY